jgi:hypothetical protein
MLLRDARNGTLDLAQLADLHLWWLGPCHLGNSVGRHAQRPTAPLPDKAGAILVAFACHDRAGNSINLYQADAPIGVMSSRRSDTRASTGLLRKADVLRD